MPDADVPPNGGEALAEAQQRLQQLEEDLQRSGKYGHMLLQRVEHLESENEQLRERSAAASEMQTCQEHDVEVEKLQERLEWMEEEHRRLQEQLEAGASSFGSAARRQKADSDWDEPSPRNGAPAAASRGRAPSDHRLSDVLRQNEDLTDQIRQLELDRQALREHNADLSRGLAEDVQAKAQEATEEKRHTEVEQKERKASTVRRGTDAIKRERTQTMEDAEILQLQAGMEQLQQQEAKAREVAKSLREQLLEVRAECMEHGSMLARTQELLTERDIEVEALRGQIQQLQGELEAESLTQRDRSDESCSLAAEMARGDADGERSRRPTAGAPLQARASLADAPLARRTRPMQQPLLTGAANPLQGGAAPRRSSEPLEVPAPQAKPANDLEWQGAVRGLESRNIELRVECDRLRDDVALALRWERRWLLVAVVMLALLIVAVLRRGTSGC